jgi:hypothetical protein
LAQVQKVGSSAISLLRQDPDARLFVSDFTSMFRAERTDR